MMFADFNIPYPRSRPGFPPITDCPQLGAADVHVFVVSLAQDVDRQWTLLSQDERERAGRYRFAKDRARFIVGRGILRRLLGHYLDRSPEDLRLVYQSSGKPELLTDVATPPMHFNVSHSEDLILIAVCRDLPIGVDIERVRAIPNMDAVARLCCCDEELREMRALPSYEKHRGFFNMWTRKEAVIKALGIGVKISFQELRVSLLPYQPPLVLSIGGNQEVAKTWTLRAVDPAPDYIAALAVCSGGIGVPRCHWMEFMDQSAVGEVNKLRTVSLRNRTSIP
jgi:4'-phosphopantetheinyl transferase